MDLDQTAGSALFAKEASNISADDESIRLFCDVCFKG